MISYGQETPRLRVSDTKETQELISLVQGNLDNMAQQVTHLYHAVTLFEHSENNILLWNRHKERSMAERFHAWRLIAAREGAFRISDFEDSLEGANGALARLCKDEIIKVEPSPFQLLVRDFPHRKSTRNSAAHSTLHTKNKSQRTKHAGSGNYEGPAISIQGNVTDVVISESLEGSRFTTTWGNNFVHYEVTIETVEKLEAIKCAFFAMIPKRLIWYPRS